MTTKPKSPAIYKLLLGGLFLYTAGSLTAGYFGYMSWQLIVASALPDSIAIYLAVVSMQMAKSLEYQNGHTVRQMVTLAENILAYVQDVEEETKAVDWSK